ncbi:MAG: hypothetical protein HQL30_12605 [Candidatus Omnitrophica bacterium]|nr:hypothetical protein [Candidatus Omnitrophota bacterium]
MKIISGKNIIGFWSFITGIIYFCGFAVELTKYLRYFNASTQQSLVHNGTILIIFFGMVAVFVSIGYFLIKLKRVALYLVTLLFVMQLFFSLFKVLFMETEPFLMDITAYKIFYLIWFIVMPLFGLVYVTRKNTKELFNVRNICS